jgi:hypothetical protein
VHHRLRVKLGRHHQGQPGQTQSPRRRGRGRRRRRHAGDLRHAQRKP